jgi:hypothetical protein
MTIEVPEHWLDTEAFMDLAHRPVPDNQEIFLEPVDESCKHRQPTTLFIDILEVVTPKSGATGVPSDSLLTVVGDL